MCLADADGSEDDRGLAGVEESQRGKVAERVRSLRRSSWVVQVSKRMAGSSPAWSLVVRLTGFASWDLVGEQCLEESDVAEFVLAGQGAPHPCRPSNVWILVIVDDRVSPSPATHALICSSNPSSCSHAAP